MFNDLSLTDLEKLFCLALLLMRSFLDTFMFFFLPGSWFSSEFFFFSCESVILLMLETRCPKTSSLGNKVQAMYFLCPVISPAY